VGIMGKFYFIDKEFGMKPISQPSCGPLSSGLADPLHFA
jgi:hypothetical protein